MVPESCHIVNAKMPRCQDAKMPRCQDAKMPRCQDPKMLGCQDAKMPRCQDAKNHKLIFLPHIVLICTPLYCNLLHYKAQNLTVQQTAVWLTAPLKTHGQGSNRLTVGEITGGKHASVATRNTEGTKLGKRQVNSLCQCTALMKQV